VGCSVATCRPGSGPTVRHAPLTRVACVSHSTVEG
jgi:hypothetical protein